METMHAWFLYTYKGIKIIQASFETNWNEIRGIKDDRRVCKWTKKNWKARVRRWEKEKDSGNVAHRSLRPRHLTFLLAPFSLLFDLTEYYTMPTWSASVLRIYVIASWPSAYFRTHQYIYIYIYSVSRVGHNARHFLNLLSSIYL